MVKKLDHDHAEGDLDGVGLQRLEEIAVAALGDELQVAAVFVVIHDIDDAHRLEIAVPLAATRAAVALDDKIATAVSAGVHGAKEAGVTKFARVENDGFGLADHRGAISPLA